MGPPPPSDHAPPPIPPEPPPAPPAGDAAPATLTRGPCHPVGSFAAAPPWSFPLAAVTCSCRAALCASRPHSLPVVWDPNFASSAQWAPWEASIAKQRADFAASLSARDRAAFCSGHRLDPQRRDELLAGLAPGVAKSRMWRFSDEPAFAPVGPAAEAAAQVRRAGPAARPAPRAMRAETILMDLWHESEDPEFLLELESCVDAITNGANFLFDGGRSAAVFQQNHGSARRNHAELVQAVERAVAKGHSIGPFPSPPFANLVVHPLGLAPKSDGSYRIIEDASMPRGDSVNDWTADVPQQYERWSCVVDHLLRAAPGSFLLQFDKSDAYRSVRLRRVEHHLTGFHVPGKGFYYSPNCPFGFKASAFLWPRFQSLFLRLLSRRLGTPVADLHVWVDDCMLVLSPCVTDALAVFSCVVAAARRYGFDLHAVKLYLARRVTFLGVEIDMVAGTLALPPSKLSEVTERLQAALEAPTWSRLTVERILGSLVHASRVLPHSRAFLGRLIAVLRSGPARSRTSPFPPPEPARQDLRMWVDMLRAWSGTSLLRVRAPGAKASLSFHCDAFGGSASNDFAGVGILCLESGEYSSQPFTGEQRRAAHVRKSYNTCLLEFAAFPWILSTFADRVRGRVIRVFCDNDGAVDVAARGFHSADAHGGLSRLLAVLTVQLDCFVIYTRIASQDNLADQLSRGRPDLFLQQARAAGLSTALSAVQCRSPSAADCESVQCSFY